MKDMSSNFKNYFWYIGVVVSLVTGIVLYSGLPKRVEATEIKNSEQDKALDKLVSSMDGYTKAQEQRNKYDLEMRQLLIDMIAKNTDRIDRIKK